jgi:hypothetical protein
MNYPAPTEEWVVGGFQILIVLLFFALGLPSVIFQISVSEEFRRITLQYQQGWYKTSFITAILLTIVTVLLLFFCYPNEDGTYPVWTRSILLASITGGILSTVVLWLFQLRGIFRERLIENIKRKIIRAVEKSGTLPNQEMEVLLYLGIQGEPGYEKTLVLQALQDISMSEGIRGDGWAMEDTLRGYSGICFGGAHMGCEENFLLAVQTLEKIMEPLVENDLSYSSDAVLGLKNLERLGAKAIDEGFDTVALQIISKAGLFDQLLFALGSAAVRNKRFDLGFAALNKLTALALQNQSQQENTATYSYLGLLAELWTAGRSGQKLAMRRLRNKLELLVPTPEDCISMAVQHHEDLSQLKTANNLVGLFHQLKEMKESPLEDQNDTQE